MNRVTLFIVLALAAAGVFVVSYDDDPAPTCPPDCPRVAR
jgi:hypothetical protein